LQKENTREKLKGYDPIVFGTHFVPVFVYLIILKKITI